MRRGAERTGEVTQSGVREDGKRQSVRHEPDPGEKKPTTGSRPPDGDGASAGDAETPDDEGVPAGSASTPDVDGTSATDPNSPGRDDAAGGDGGESGRRRGGRAPRRRRLLKWSAVVLAVLILGTAGAGYLYYLRLNGNIKKDALNLGDNKVAAPTPNAAGQTPLNILLIGSDARDTEENQKLGGARETFGATPLADVQMLLHLSADRTNMSVVSMPRDTLVKIPKCTDPDDGKVYPATLGRTMTNQSLGHGGPGCTVATWQELTGIHIDHFIMVDFAGVVSMADAVGGVPVCVDANIHSRTSDGNGSGLKLEKGTTYIKGEQALQWLRTRYGFEDGSDLARAKAQHMYMNAMVRRLRDERDPEQPEQAPQTGRGGHPGPDGRPGPRHRQEALRPQRRAAQGGAGAHHHDHDAQPRTWAPVSSPRRTPSSCSGWCGRTSPWTARTRRGSRPRRRPPSTRQRPTTRSPSRSGTAPAPTPWPRHADGRAR